MFGKRDGTDRFVKACEVAVALLSVVAAGISLWHTIRAQHEVEVEVVEEQADEQERA